MKTERVAIASLHLDPANARSHSDRNLKAIAASLARFGQQRPILIDSNGVVRAGNGTLHAAIDLGWTEIDVVTTDLKGSEATAYAIADNRTAELAEWDDSVLAAQLEALHAEDESLLTDVGFTDEELAAMLEDDEVEITEDEPPEPPPEAVTKPGELWALGDHLLLCGDCTKEQDVLKLFNGNRVGGICFTSPPYLEQRTYQGADVSIETIVKFLPLALKYSDVVCVNLGISRKDGAIECYWNDYIKAANDAGGRLVSWNVWDRGRPCSVGQQTATFPIEHEFIFVFATGDVQLIPTIPNKTAGQKFTARVRDEDGNLGKLNEGIKRSHRELGTVWRGDPVIANDDHPAAFPVALPGAYIGSVGGSVFEPFAGSGTTIIAAEQLGRSCFAMELNPIYCDVAIKRWEKLTGRSAERL